MWVEVAKVRPEVTGDGRGERKGKRKKEIGGGPEDRKKRKNKKIIIINLITEGQESNLF